MNKFCANIMLCILMFFIKVECWAEESEATATAWGSARAWWPDVVTPGSEGVAELNRMRQEQLKKYGKLSRSVSKPLEDVARLKGLAKPDREVLQRLHALRCFPRVQLLSEDHVLHIKAVDLSGRSGEAGGEETNMQFNSNVGDEVVSVLASLPKLEAVFAFGTRITDVGMESIVKLPHIRAVWLPPAATDRSVYALAHCKQLQWMSTLGARVTSKPFSAIAGLPSLSALFVWCDDSVGVRESLSTSSSLKLLVVNGVTVIDENRKRDNP